MQLDLSKIPDTLLQSADLPLLAAFLLGVMVALNPCQLAICVSALAYEYRNGKRMKSSVLFALGRGTTYTLLGWGTMYLIGKGWNTERFQTMLSWAEVAVPYILIFIGFYLFYRAFHHHHHDGEKCHNSGNIIRHDSAFGSFFLGMILALAFCPESAIFYFGMMIPLSLSSSHVRVFIPLVFGLSACLPVIIIAWLMNEAMHRVERLSQSLGQFQQWLNGITGALFILIAILLLI